MRTIAHLICLAVGAAAGWGVYGSVSEVFGISIGAGAGTVVAIVVYPLLYLPLARHLADAVGDRLSVMVHRGKNIRAGTGLDHVPVSMPPRAVPCALCGSAGGPICPTCETEMKPS